MTSGTPPAEYPVDEALVRGLLQDQHPDLAGLPLRRMGEGWDNVMFRLGEDMIVRAPRRALAGEIIAHEQDWLPSVAAGLPFAAPIPLRNGVPGRGYPWRWSILPWLEGETANLAPPDDDQALVLAAALRMLHRPAPDAAPFNPYRGGPLSSVRERVEQRLADLEQHTDAITPAIRAAWRDGLVAPRTRDRLWFHGDLHSRNILVRGGKITALIDWGDMAGGDAATDLSAFWVLFEDAALRSAALDAYGADEALRTRARGWAVMIGSVLLSSGRIDHPEHAAIGAATLRRVDAEG